jgi:hypothetical protein
MVEALCFKPECSTFNEVMEFILMYPILPAAQWSLGLLSL